MRLELHAIVQAFAVKWGPGAESAYLEFIADLRDVLEAYGAGVMLHQSLPDTEHKHGDPL